MLSGRFRNLGIAAGWPRINLHELDAADATKLLAQELRVPFDYSELWTLVNEVGALPLVLHLATGYLNAGQTVTGFLRRFRSTGFGLPPRDPTDHLFQGGKARAAFKTSLDLSLKALQETFEPSNDDLMDLLWKLGDAPLWDFDRVWGARATGLSEDDFENFMDKVVQLSLAVQLAGEKWRLHPLVAESFRMRAASGRAKPRVADRSAVQGDIDRIRNQTPRLKFVAIRNFKSIPALDLDFVHPSESSGTWTCIAGVNGAGKSAVLQAIALVLLGDRLSLVIGDQWLDRARRRTDDNVMDAEIRATVQSGTETLDLVLPIGPGRIDLENAIPESGKRDRVKAFWDDRERDHLLLSYGAGRNLSEYVDSRHGAKGDDVKRQMTLFDPLAQVASVEVLLKQAPDHAPILVLLKRLLSVVLEGTSLEVAPQRDTLRFMVDEAIVEAAELPDGFRATIAWLADLCAAWCAKAPHEAESGDPAQIRAIVLIDEIDLHLHPSLQRVLVPRLRKALPEVQWIVTTHSPLVLASFDKSELVCLDAKEPGGKRVIDRQILGFTMDEVYEWLMGTEPQSAALDDIEGDPRDAEARLARILAQSPDVGEEKARDNEEWRSRLVETMRRKDAESGHS